ncbi:hypothetical protein M885DRAFT_542745 [Pelagophyceae sp. CCMP2097]|nr:hypothetical protein M885DRAFT_542745 [Pelagophyceae sp. CCMP2097]
MSQPSAVQQSRKRVLRARGPPAELAAAADLAHGEAEARFAARLDKLTEFKAQHRTASRLHDVRAEWVAAHQDLRKTEAELWRDAQKCPEGSRLANDASQAAADARGKSRRAFENQLTELRDLTKMCALLVAAKARQGSAAGEVLRSASADAARTARRPRLTERSEPRAEEGADDREEQLMEAQGLVAQILVDFRDALARADADLAAEEAVAAADAGAARRSVAAALAEDDEAERPGGDLDALLDPSAIEDILEDMDAEAKDALDVELAELRRELAHEWAARGRGESAEARAAPTAEFEGWDARSRAVFAECVALRSCVNGSLAAKMARLRVALPGFGDEALAARLEGHDAAQRSAREARAAKEADALWRDTFAKRARDRVRLAAAEVRDAARLRADYAALEARRRELHESLAALREDRSRSNGARRQLALDAAQAQADDDALRARAAEEAQAVRRAAVRRYKASLAAARADNVARDATDRAAQNAAKPARVRACAERSVYREKERQRAFAEAHREREKLLRREVARAAALAALAASVPYAETMRAIVADPFKSTAATEASRADRRAELDIVRRGGVITDAALFRDARFKLGFALRAAGIIHTAAAGHAVSAAIPRNARNPITG